MRTELSELAGSILQRVSIAVLITAAFLSAAFAAMLPSVGNSHRAPMPVTGSVLSPLAPSSSSDQQTSQFSHSWLFNDRLAAEFGLYQNRLLKVSESPPVFQTAGTRYFSRQYLKQVDAKALLEKSASGPDELSIELTKWAMGGVSFPNLAVTKKLPVRRFIPMIAYHANSVTTDGTPEPIPAVRCMGLSPTAIARRAARYEDTIQRLSMKYGVSINLVKAVITKESCFDPKAESYAGAIGLMQLMPATAAWLEVADPTDPEQNLDGGIKYLASLYERFGRIDLTLAAYNAGPGNVHRHKGIPPFQETQGYVKSVLSHYRFYTQAARFKSQLALN